LWSAATRRAGEKIRKNPRKTLDSRGVIPIIGRIFFAAFHRFDGEEKEVIMTSTRIVSYTVYDVSVRDIPEG
jgi:hypothetical protein